MRPIASRRESDDFDLNTVATIDIETVQPEAEDGAFRKWPHHVPILASVLIAQRQAEGTYAFALDTVRCARGNEAAFLDKLEERLPELGTTCSFNGRGFDLPVLMVTAAASRGCRWPRLSQLFRANRYGRTHCDLAEQFSGYRGAPLPSLAEICDRLQVPIKTCAEGSEVATLYAAGNIDAVQAYCEEDVLATYLAHLHWMAFRNADDAVLALPLSQLAAWIEQRADLSHLKAFASCPPAVWARQRALEITLERAAEDARRRADKARLAQEMSRNVIAF